MPTVVRMFKRILTLATGVALGLGLAFAGLRAVSAWRLFPNRELERASNRVHEVLELVHENYVEPKSADYDELAKLALYGMVESLDPHSEFMEAKDNRDFEEELSGEFGGIGVQVETRGEKVVVISPMPGSPSERAGILRGDEFESIDGKPVEKASAMNDVVSRLRGAPKSKVAIGLYRPATQKNIDVMLVRELIKVASVRDPHRVADGVGYIELTEFSEHTGEQFRAALDGLLQQGIDSLIIDLRNNPGGLLDAAVEVAEIFFKKGELIVYTQGRKPGDRDDYRSEIQGPPLDLPIAVLINGGSASAAEVVTGAFKDTGRAVVVGERSFGKGSVQSIFKLKNGDGLRLTTARYFTPSGVSIHEKGIGPNVEVVMTADEDNKLDLQRSRSELTAPKQFKDRFGFEPVQDRQLQAAIDVLRGVNLLEARAANSRPIR